MTGTGLIDVVEPAVNRGDCEHTAVLLTSAEALPPLLASFFNFGASRNGWLVHGSLPGEADDDRSRMTGAGLDVAALESAGRLAVAELDLTVSPQEWVGHWSELLDAKLGSGFDAMWFARFPIGPTDDDVAGVLPFEAAWMDRFHDRRVVTLCPYIVVGLGEHRRAEHRREVGSVHDRIFEPTP